MNRPFDRRAMVSGLMGRAPFRVGNSTIDPMSRDARWEGGEERLQPQTLKVLIALAARRGEVVTRDELVELCWNGRIVGDDVLNRSISLLRHFADRAGGFSIETVPRAGYRLIEGGETRPNRRRRLGMAAATALLLATLGTLIALRPSQPDATPLTVGILPFASASDEGSKRLAAEVEDASTRMLSETGISVEVMHRGQVQQAPPDFVLSGTIGREAELPVATVRLEDPRRHTIVLLREIRALPADPGALPEQVGANLAAALSWAGPLIRLDRQQPSDPAFIANLLRTRETNFDSQGSFEFLRRHAPSAPNSAIAQLSLAMLTGMNLADLPAAERPSALSAGQAAANQAIRLAPSYGDAQIPWCMLHAEARLTECELHLRHGMAADHMAPFASSILSHLLLNVGRIDEANAVAAEALAKDMYVPSKMAGSIAALDATGRTRDADALYRRGHRLWPNYSNLLLKRIVGLIARGDFEALSILEQQEKAALPLDYPSLAEPLAQALRTGSLSLARETCGHMGNDDLPVIQCMLVLARLGDVTRSFRLAERIYPRRTGRSVADEEALWLSNADDLDTVYITAMGAAPLRRDPRFLSLADRLGLLRYWRSGHLPDFCTRTHELICDKI